VLWMAEQEEPARRHVAFMVRTPRYASRARRVCTADLFSRSISDFLFYGSKPLRPMINFIRRLVRWNMKPARITGTSPGLCPQPP
jgi:hypothetical protein